MFSVLPPILAGRSDGNLEECLSRMAMGDEAALGSLYDQIGELLFSLARRITGNDREAEEIVQDVFLIAWKHASNFDAQRSSPKTWLTMLARNKSIDRVRMSRRRLAAAPTDNRDFGETAGSTPPDAPAKDRAKSATASVAELPPDQRQAVELAFFDGRTHPEISILLNETIGTIQSRIRLGLDRLRKSPRFHEFAQPSVPSLAAHGGSLPPVIIISPFAIGAEASTEPNKV